MSDSILKEIISKEVRRIVDVLKEERIEEDGHVRLVRCLAGMESDINTVGIITAENPEAKKIEPKRNKVRNKDLAEELNKLGYDFYQLGGRYGDVEKPYVVPNISKKDLVKLGSEYDQDSVIFVKEIDGGSEAELIETLNGNYSIRAKVTLPFVQDAEEFYSIYKDRDYVIPFFNDILKNNPRPRD